MRLVDQSAGRAAERMRVDFVANASHELRTPLATIAGYAETSSTKATSTRKPAARFGSVILAEAKRMLRIVEDLMSLSRIEAERFMAPREAVDLAEVERLAAEHAAPLIREQACAIELAVEDGLPAVPGDFAQLLQTADNLVANAIRYGCRQGHERHHRGPPGRRSRLLAVRDLATASHRNICPAYTSASTGSTPPAAATGGTGLGLAIVKHIVERHRGTLDIRSAPGRTSRSACRSPELQPLS